MRDDLAYFTRRAAQERLAMSTAADPKARRAHEQLAEHYEEWLRAAGQVQTAPQAEVAA